MLAVSRCRILMVAQYGCHVFEVARLVSGGYLVLLHEIDSIDTLGLPVSKTVPMAVATMTAEEATHVMQDLMYAKMDMR